MAPMKRLTRPDDLLQQLNDRLQETQDDKQRERLRQRIRVTQKACDAAHEPIGITPRDVAIMRFIAMVRFATTEQIVRFSYRSRK